MCHLREHLARIFFPAHCTCMNFFWHDGLVQEFFLMHMHLQDIFFQNHRPPPPPQKLNGRPLIVVNNTICLHFILLNFTYFCLNIAEKALCVYDMFCGIQEILLLLNKNNTQNDSSRP